MNDFAHFILFVTFGIPIIVIAIVFLSMLGSKKAD